MALLRFGGGETQLATDELEAIGSEFSLQITPVKTGVCVFKSDGSVIDYNAKASVRFLNGEPINPTGPHYYAHCYFRYERTGDGDVDFHDLLGFAENDDYWSGVYARVGLARDNPNTKLHICCFEDGGGSGASTGTINLAQNTWYRLDFYWRDVDGNSYMEAKLNGATEVSSTPMYKGASITRGILGAYRHDPKADQHTDRIACIDDYWFNDGSGSQHNGWPPDVRVLRRAPDSQGTHNDYTGDPEAANKYLNWDDLGSDGDTTDNFSGAYADEQQTSGLAAHGLAADEHIEAVEIDHIAADYGYVLMRDGATDALSPQYSGDATFRLRGKPWSTRPATGSEWKMSGGKTAFDSLEAGAEGAAASVNKVTALYPMIAYAPGAETVVAAGRSQGYIF